MESLLTGLLSLSSSPLTRLPSLSSLPVMIDLFLEMVADRVEILHQDYQIIIRKR